LRGRNIYTLEVKTLQPSKKADIFRFRDNLLAE
jgi:hypothetical protein